MSSVKKRPNGKWRARYRDGTGKEPTRHFDRKTDARDWLDEVTASLVTGTYVAPSAGKITLDDYFKQWSARQIWVGGTGRSMKLTVKSAPFSTLSLKVIQPSHVEQWVKELTARGLAARTVHNRVQNMSTIFRGAIRDKLIALNPTVGVTLPRLRKAEAAMVLPTLAQVKALLDSAPVKFRPMVALAAFAGLRDGEIRALQLGDVNFLGRTIHVQRQVQHTRPGYGLDIRPPKFGSERTVFAAEALITILSQHVAEQTIAGAGEYLFKGRGDRPMHASTAHRLWSATRVAAKAPKVKLHDLRHFYASGLIAAGCDVVTVQRALGHSKATVTLDTYSHLWPTAEDRTRRAAGGLLATVLEIAADQARTGQGG